MKKLIKRKNILKEAGVLLIAAILVLTSIFVLIPTTIVTKADPSPFFESFEDPWVPDSDGDLAPAGWEVVSHSGLGKWLRYPYGHHTYEPSTCGCDDYYASCWYTSGGTFDVSLFTPALVCTATPTTLQVCRAFQDYAGYGQAAIRSYSGGTSPGNLAEELWYGTADDIPRDGIWTVMPMDTTDSSIYPDLSEVYIEFWYSDDGYGNAWGFGIDCVEINADVANNPPYIPRDPVPIHMSADNPACTTCLYWIGGDPDEPPDFATYDIYLDTTNPPTNLVASGLTYDDIPWCPPSGMLISGTTYFWQIVSTDTYGAITPGPIWWFTTEPCTLSINSINIVGSGKKVQVKIDNGYGSAVNNVKVKMKFTPTEICCGPSSGYLSLSISPHHGGFLTVSPGGVWTATWPSINIPPGGRDFEVEVSGCACFDLTVTVDACSSAAGCIIQETRHGRICELSLWP